VASLEISHRKKADYQSDDDTEHDFHETNLSLRMLIPARSLMNLGGPG
jgi:hypothetical protein